MVWFGNNFGGNSNETSRDGEGEGSRQKWVTSTLKIGFQLGPRMGQWSMKSFSFSRGKILENYGPRLLDFVD